MDSSALSNAEFWISIFNGAKLVAAFLVAIGVAVEFGADFAARPYEKVVKDSKELQLKSLENEASLAKAALVDAQKKITDANLMANSAASDAAKLGVSVGDLHGFVAEKERLNNAAIEELKKNTAGLDKARDDALKAAQESKKVLAEMNNSLEKEMAARQKIIDSLKPRHIPLAKRIAISNHINIFHGIRADVLRLQTSSIDSDALANEILEILRQSHWAANGVTTIAFSGSAKGVSVLKRAGSNDSVKKAAELLINELRGANILVVALPDFSGDGRSSILGRSGSTTYEGSFNDSPGDPDIIVAVGDKP